MASDKELLQLWRATADSAMAIVKHCEENIDRLKVMMAGGVAPAASVVDAGGGPGEER